jgi:hypothetical protein
MPKINVYAPGTNTDRRIEVAWWPNGTVQVGATCRHPVKAIQVTGIDGTTATMGPAVLDGTVEDGGWTWDGQHTDLDRHGLNQLIRALREARDKAYGRDE